MGYESRQQERNETKRVFMVCEDEGTRKDFADLLKRVSSVMSAVETFADKMADLDEDAANLTDLAAPTIERFWLTIVSVYPNGPRQMQSDIKSIGDFTIRSAK